MSTAGRLLVSIHDVTPALDDGVRQLWAMCRAAALTPALLVVPDWHGRWPIERHAAFMAWVRARVDDGAEIVLHGERHDEVGLPRTWRDTVRAVGRTAREGEFLTLDADAARARIVRGLERLATHGLSAAGFIPPAWLAREATHTVVRELGLGFSEDADSVRVNGPADQMPRRLDAPALRWSGRTSMRAWGSLAMAEGRWRLWQRAPLLRLALHPQDLQHTVTARSVARDVARWAHVRSAIRYDALSGSGLSS
jgi:predicted deacetylase